MMKEMYGRARTAVKSAAGLTEGIEVAVGIYQGSAFGPFLFAIIMNKLTVDIRTEAPKDMLFADDIALCREEKRVPEKT